MKCSTCGDLMAENSRFCMKCGSKVERIQFQPIESFQPRIIQIHGKKQNGFTFVFKGRNKVLCTVRFLVGSELIPKAVLQLSGPCRMDLDEFLEVSSFMKNLVRKISGVPVKTKPVWEAEVEIIFKKSGLLN